MFWLSIILMLSIKINAVDSTTRPAEVWKQLQLTESKPISYEEVVVVHDGVGFSVHYFRVMRKDPTTERIEETSYYSNDVLKVELKVGNSLFLCLGTLPIVLKSRIEEKDDEEFLPIGIEEGMLDEKAVLILYLQSKKAPTKITKYLNPSNNTLVKEEIYFREKLVKVRERRNIVIDPPLNENLFKIPSEYRVFTDRRAWERALIYEISKNFCYDVYYPDYLPSNWELVDISFNSSGSFDGLVYRFFDGKEFYSLFLGPLPPDFKSSKQHYSVLYKDSMGVFQLVSNEYIITIVGKLQEKIAKKIINSLTLIDK